MDAVANSEIESRPLGNVFIKKGTDATGDVILLPTDLAGTPGILNGEVLEKLGLNLSIIPGPNKLSRGYALINIRKQWIGFVVTVGNGDVADMMARNLTAALRDKRLSKIKALWIPLMGTGAGKLPFELSYRIMSALHNTGWVSRSDARITIAIPPNISEASLRAYASTDKAKNNSADNKDNNNDNGPADDDRIAGFQPNAAVRAALTFATSLREGRRQQGGSLSTTLLFFALAESQIDAAPRELADDRAASLFSGAVHSLAGHRFRDAWESYFIPGHVVATSRPLARSAAPTPNVLAVLQNASKLATDLGRPSIEIDDLIVSLLSHSKGRHRSSLETMGISTADLLREYRDALTGQIGKTLLNDVAAEADRLGYDSYADAIKDFLTDVANPQTIFQQMVNQPRFFR
jgi:hypothetical protein